MEPSLSSQSGQSGIPPEFIRKRKAVETNYPKRRAVICDLDGTLAHCCERDIYDFSKVIVDVVDQAVRDVVAGLILCGYSVIFVSGRSNECRLETEEWIGIKTGLTYNAIYMREKGDKRPDEVVKRELYETMIKPLYDVRLVIDDRPKVCRMWRELGLKVLQCGDPHVEF